MTVEEFLRESVLVLAFAVTVVLASARLRIPSVVGLLVTGLVIGPSGLALVPDVNRVEIFAEIGVVLLLFTIGLELTLSQLRELGRPFLIAGSVQCALTAALVMLVATSILPLRPALFIGLAVSLSSTAVVLRLYEARRETESPQGRVALGILLFQDLLIVPIIVLTPVLAGAVEASALDLTVRFGGALAAIAVVFLLARFAMPRLYHLLVATRIRELFVLSTLGTCLAMAWFTAHLGFSLALGAFLAGLIVSETEYSHQVIADIVPFRDLFASLFFISIGMLVDIPFALARLPTLAGLGLLLIVGKAATVTLAIKLAGYPLRIAIIGGLSLAQIGEFSFVIMEVGRAHGLLAGESFQILLVVAVLTLAVTPFLIHAAPTLGRRAVELMPLPEGRETAGAPAEDLSEHVVVVGYGVAGSLLSGVLSKARIPYVVLELNPAIVRSARKAGTPILFGDCTRRDILERAGIERAKVVVFAISDAAAVRHSVRLARQLSPAVQTVVRTRAVKGIEELRRAGADQVVAEEFESAIEIFTRVLEHYHVPRNIIRAQTRTLRGEGYRMLRAEPIGRDVSQAVLDALEAGTTDLFRVSTDGRVVGRTLRDLDLRRRTGTSVIAVVRGEVSYVNPSPELSLQPGDCLVLVGSHLEIDRAFQYLDIEV